MNPGMHLRTNQETLNTITTEPYTVKIEVQVLLTHLCTLKLLLSFILCTVITSSIVIHVTIIMITIITRLYHYCYCRNTTCIIMCVYIDTYIHLYIYMYIALCFSLSLAVSLSQPHLKAVLPGDPKRRGHKLEADFRASQRFADALLEPGHPQV